MEITLVFPLGPVLLVLIIIIIIILVLISINHIFCVSVSLFSGVVFIIL